MAQPMTGSLRCPKCKHDIPLTESLAAPFVEQARREFESTLAARNAEIAEREAEITQEHAAIESLKRSIEHRISMGVVERLDEERERLLEHATANARLEMSAAISERDSVIASLKSAQNDLTKRLSDAQGRELELEVDRRALETRIAEQDLVVERRVQEAMTPLRAELGRQAEERAVLSVRERDIIIEQLRGQIDELKQRVDQGSQQLQGEAQEVHLEDELQRTFAIDRILPVPKGEAGGDVLQLVLTAGGQAAGSILWESKRTKHWNEDWLAKVRADQRKASADAAVIVTRALPKGITTFALVEGVWVVSSPLAMPVATMLRQAILKFATLKSIAEGKQTKAELLYQYLNGPTFSARLSTLAEAFNKIRAEHETERKILLRQWAKREQQLKLVEAALMGFLGDVEGIAGSDVKALADMTVAISQEAAPIGELPRTA